MRRFFSPYQDEPLSRNKERSRLWLPGLKPSIDGRSVGARSADAACVAVKSGVGSAARGERGCEGNVVSLVLGKVVRWVKLQLAARSNKVEKTTE